MARHEVFMWEVTMNGPGYSGFKQKRIMAGFADNLSKMLMIVKLITYCYQSVKSVKLIGIMIELQSY